MHIHPFVLSIINMSVHHFSVTYTECWIWINPPMLHQVASSNKINVVGNVLVCSWLMIVSMTLRIVTHVSLILIPDAVILHFRK